jgi:predicted DNA-binding protein (UPF0251 family)/predicted Fe-Mo cluster-binding NifX family protein
MCFFLATTEISDIIYLLTYVRNNMPRPQKKRRIRGLPQYNEFTPEDSDDSQSVHLTLDEYETIRLIDGSDYKQEDCALAMQISRTSVTAIYDSARHKIADALIHGKKLYITGGSYQVSSCCMHQREHACNAVHPKRKGDKEMRIAVTYENGEIFQHFGRTPSFKIYDVKDKNILESVVISNNGTGHGALAGILAMAQVDALICGGMGMGAQYALADAGITVFAGVSGNADEAVQAFLDGTLDYVQEANCDHHEEGEGCGCGEHEEGGCGCGGHQDDGCGCC